MLPGLKHLLTQWALQSYFDNFRRNGIEHVNVLLNMDDNDISLVIPVKAHDDRIKLKQHIKEYKKENVSFTHFFYSKIKINIFSFFLKKEHRSN